MMSLTGGWRAKQLTRPALLSTPQAPPVTPRYEALTNHIAVFDTLTNQGVMLSQDNITWTCSRAHEVYDWKFDHENVVSYLPLSHVAGTFIDIYLIMYGGGAVYFADKMALQGTLLKTLVEAKPTLFFGVPRVYEKIQEKMKEAAKLNTGLKKKLSDIAKEAALEHHFATFEGKSGGGLKYKLGKKVVMSKVAKALGFERTRGFYSSAAPLSEDVFR